MEAKLKERVLNQVQQLSSLLRDTEGVLDTSLNSLARHVDEHERILSEVGNPGSRAQQVSENVGHVLDSCAHALQRLSAALPDLLGATKPLLDDMLQMDQTLEELERLAHVTLLSALNASAAAERAGEAGDAFAVVAYEVAALPTRTTEVGTEIRSTIGAVSAHLKRVAVCISNGASMGSGVVGQASDQIRELNSELRRHGLLAASEVTRSTHRREATQQGVMKARRAVSRFDAGRGHTTHLLESLIERED